MVALWLTATIRLNGDARNTPLLIVPTMAWIGPGLLRCYSDHPRTSGWIAYCVLYALAASFFTLVFAAGNNFCLANTDCDPDPRGIDGLLSLIFFADLVLVAIGCRLAIPPLDERPLVRYDP
jgi:hypothetical protein